MVSVREAINYLVVGSVFFAAQIPDTVMGNAELRMWCIFGAVAGGMVSVIFMPPKTPKETAAKWLASSTLSVLIAPAALTHFEISLTSDMVMCISGLIAFLAWSILRLITQRFESFSRRTANVSG